MCLRRVAFRFYNALSHTPNPTLTCLFRRLLVGWRLIATVKLPIERVARGRLKLGHAEIDRTVGGPGRRSGDPVPFRRRRRRRRLVLQLDRPGPWWLQTVKRLVVYERHSMRTSRRNQQRHNQYAQPGGVAIGRCLVPFCLLFCFFFMIDRPPT